MIKDFPDHDQTRWDLIDAELGANDEDRELDIDDLNEIESVELAEWVNGAIELTLKKGYTNYRGISFGLFSDVKNAIAHAEEAIEKFDNELKEL